MLLDRMKSLIDSILSSPDYQNEYGTICLTKRGEKVKSKAEKKIADYLNANNFRYEYERPALTSGVWIFRDEISHPDFYLSDFDVYIEYWGLVNAKESRVRKNYTRTMKWKMLQYHENNIKCISLYPNNLDNLDWIFKAKLRDVIGMEPSASPCISKEHSKEHLDNHLQSIVIRGLAKHRENLVITNERRGMTIRQRAWMKKEDWNDINQVLRSNGFRWISNAKDSCWLKTM